MKFIYSLQSVLQYRQQIEDVNKEKYIQISAELNSAVSILEAIKKELDSAISDAVDKKCLSIEEHKNYMHYIVNLEKRVQNQKLKIYDIETAKEQIRIELEEAMKERKIMESLGEKELERYLAEFKRREEKELNEIAIIGYARQHRRRTS